MRACGIHKIDESGKTFRLWKGTCKKRSRLVIGLADAYGQLEDFILAVHRLRKDGNSVWHGAFLEIVANRANMEALKELDIFGDKQRRFSFGSEPWHIIIHKPVSVAELIQVLAEIKEIGRNTWRSRFKTAEAVRIVEYIQRARTLLLEGRIDEAAHIAQNIFSEISEIE